MIVSMKKVTLPMLAKEREEILKKLRQIGVLHIKNIREPVSEDIRSLEGLLANVERALELTADKPGRIKKIKTDNVPSIVDEILSLDDRRGKLSPELAEQEEIFSWFDQWGGVSRDSVEQLRSAGLYVRFYITSKGSLKQLPQDKAVQIIREEKGTVYLAFFTDSKDDTLDLKEEPMPEVEYAILTEQMKAIREELSGIDKRIGELARYRDALATWKADLGKRIEFQRVKHGMGDEERFLYLQGFCPVETVEAFRKTAEDEGWAYVIQDPDQPEETPTLIRNPKWLRIIDPLFNFMGTLPGYDEFDISIWFLLFFSLFFAMLIGDAGYGLVFLGLTIFASRKNKNIPKEPLMLVYVLSGATIVWGIITGTWFGYGKIAQLPILNLAVIDQIDSFAEGSQNSMMYLCFVIGLVHLSIAHSLRALRIINSPKALAEVGWIGILLALFFLAGSLVIGKPFSPIAWFCIIGGTSLVLLFSNFQKNIIKGVLVSLGDLPLSAISSFSDIVSYLRLFAVGYASVTVASSFNSMAADAGFGSILTGFVAAFILFFGHTLNIMLGLMSVIVHGIRLNMLEFSGHLNMQWAGKKYHPFQE